MFREFKQALTTVLAGRNFLQSLIAVISGNAIYFLLLVPYLPPVARHRMSKIDLGLLLDFWICLVIYGLLELLVRRRKRTRSADPQT
jgi:hypothetical protein